MQPVYKNPNVPTTEQVYRTNLIIWAALLMSQLLLLFMLFMVKPELFGADALANFKFEPDALVIALAALGLTTFALSFVLKARFLKLAIENKSVALVQTAQIVAYALCEAVSLFGMVLAFAAGFPLFFLWFAVGVIGHLLHFPRREHFNAASFTGINLK